MEVITVRKMRSDAYPHVQSCLEAKSGGRIQHLAEGFAHFFVFGLWGSQGWYEQAGKRDKMRMDVIQRG